MNFEVSAVNAAGGYGPPGGGGYGGSPPGSPPGGGYGPPGSAPPGGGYGGPPPGGYGQPPGGYVPPPGGGPPQYGGGFGPPPGFPTGPGQTKAHPLAITSLVLGLLSLPLCCCSIFGVWAPIGAIVTGILGLNKIKAEPHLFKGTNLCIAGMVAGGIGLMLDVVALTTSVTDGLRRYGQMAHH